ncbi:glycosyltransferase family 4 protein [Mahella australiensis]|uniref:Glycosyl transferase group 1 n=1 Tax=Mahella australiensis (strain DSM 15567 / CIP 107919 / 50-1 BON) TaxID=697281 RepID=F3ZXR6_MAHA5|nr:glycosyltransferase family 4 protein [Mahella australiensis]AEE95573.1 glycosyl transferase group 1 [Mahella australiensis 50-1 BON]
MRHKAFIASAVHKWDDPRIFYKEAMSLAKKYDVEIMAIADFDYKEINGIKVYGLPKRKRYARLLNWWKLLIMAIRIQGDVYHFHDPELIPFGLILKLLGKKVVYDIHEDYPKAIMSKTWIPKKVRHLVSSVFNFLEKDAAKWFDYNITVTDDIAKNFKKSRITVIKNYPLYEQRDINSKKPKDEIWAVYVGGLASIRGVQEMVEAVAYADPKYNIKLKLAGRFMPPQLEEYIRNIAGSNVDIIGFLDYNKVYELLMQCDIGLVCLHPMPNYVTSLPLKMFEYMSCALPIIASNFPLWKQIIDNDRCGITVNPQQPRDIAKAINYLAANPDVRYEMGMNGYKAYKDKYNWAAEERKLLDVYERILNR